MGGQDMLTFTCDRNTLIDIGKDVTVRVVSIGEENVELEIQRLDGDACPDSDAEEFLHAKHATSSEPLAPASAT
jgi:hypothetical protein